SAFNQSLSEGRVPANEILEGVALLIGGALLLTPGFFTDLIGFFCLLPITRRPVVTLIVNRFNPMSGMDMGGVPPSYGPSGNNSGKKSGNVIEGEVTHRSED
ncbi:MAG: FxsA family protein, partial [Gammaproteobacteria bacterium]|nr:FxsA family protein [Gammaproteobacteria bacterium]